MVLPCDRPTAGTHPDGSRTHTCREGRFVRISSVGLLMFVSSTFVGFLLVRGFATGLTVGYNGGGERMRPGEMVATYLPAEGGRELYFWEAKWKKWEHGSGRAPPHRHRFRGVRLRSLSELGSELKEISDRVQVELMRDLEAAHQRANPTTDHILNSRGGGEINILLDREEDRPGGSIRMRLSGKLNYCHLSESAGSVGQSCVTFPKPLGEYTRHGPAQKLGSYLGIGKDVAKNLMDNSKSPPDWCPEPIRRHGEPCIWGSGLVRAFAMRPAFFFIRFAPATTRCYVRATGAGILLPTLTLLDRYTLRADYIPEQEGMYQFWIMCTSVASGQRRQWPHGSRYLPWFHNYLTRWSPYNLTVEPNRQAPPRGCTPCTPQAMSMQGRGQWVKRAVLECLCGGEGLGAVGEWVVDEYMWAPRRCLIPFVGREEFRRRMGGRGVAVAGDASMRGHYVELVNWLGGVGPEVLQDQGGYQFIPDRHTSSWDGLVAGFNGFPFTQDVDVVLPNPWTADGVFLQYFEAEGEERWQEVVDQVQLGFTIPNGTFQRPPTGSRSEQREFDSVVFNFAGCERVPQSGSDPYPPSLESGAAVQAILHRLRCGRGVEVDGEEEGGGEVCEGGFKGEIVYRTGTGRFDDSNFCLRQNETSLPTFGRSCSVNSGIFPTLARSSSRMGERGIKIIHAFELAFSRPDRSIDSRLFYPRKCSVDRRQCSGQEDRDVHECCFPANLFPHVVSSTLTNMLVHNLLADISGVDHERVLENDEEYEAYDADSLGKSTVDVNGVDMPIERDPISE